MSDLNDERDASARAPQAPLRWGFSSAAGVILLLVLIGQVVGVMLASFNQGEGWFNVRVGGADVPIGLKQIFFLGFLASSLCFLVMQWGSVARFFRTMQVGVTLVVLSALSVVLGVLVPQISSFEDPDVRVTPENYEEEYAAFRWAEGYFLYHLLHLYGIGMPEGELPPQAEAGLERFERAYGRAEGKNRRKRMEAAFSGQAKTAEIGALIDEHDTGMRRFFDVCTALHFNRAYKSNWFATLITLLGIGIAFNTFRGPPRTWVTARRAGFFVTHIGMMTMLLGGGLSKWKTDRGIMHLFLGEQPQNEYWRHFNRNKIGVMPFHVGLDRYARQDWKQLELRFLDRSFTSKPPPYTLWKGREIELDYAEDIEGVDGASEKDDLRPRLKLRVLDLFERSAVGMPSFWECEPELLEQGIGPMCELRVPDWGAQERPGDPVPEAVVFRKPDWQDRFYHDPLWNYRLLTSFGESSLEDLRELFPPTDDKLALLGARVSGAGDGQDHWQPIGLEGTLALPGGYTLEVLDAHPNFRLDPNLRVPIEDPRPIAEQPPLRPALRVSITGPDGGREERWVFSFFEAEGTSVQESYAYSELILKLEWSRWQAPGPPRYILHWDQSARATLVREEGAPIPLVVGENLPLPGDHKVKLQQVLVNARIEKDVQFLAPIPAEGDFDADFYAPEQAGLELEVTTWPGTQQESVQVIRLAATADMLADQWQDPERRFVIRFFENANIFPYEWRSVLSIYEDDGQGRLRGVDLGPESEREIRVNDYFFHRGYRFFQTNARPDLPNYSGIGVVYDPGIPVVLTGMYTIILGTVLAFIVRPIADARRRKRSAGAAA